MPVPEFFIRDIPIYGDLILSPMAGYSDVPYRTLCRSFGSAMQYTEFVAVEYLQGKRNRSWKLLDFKPEEQPKVFQIFGNDAQKILRAAQNIEQLGPDIIDINMGCSSRKVSGRGAGVGMMKSPQLIAETFRLLSTHLSVPVTGKIRLGWEENRNYLKIAQIMVDNGAALIAMHGRTKEQKYSGTADWDAIATLKQSVSVPVIGNGDVVTPEDVDKMRLYTGCDAVMIGRGAIGNPWIFGRRRWEDVTFPEIMNMIRLHFDEMVSYYDERTAVSSFRKHLKRYLQRMPQCEGWIKPLMIAAKPDAVLATLAELENAIAPIYQPSPPEDAQTGEAELGGCDPRMNGVQRPLAQPVAVAFE